MQLSAKEAWKRILDAAQRELPADVIRNWLEPTEAISLEGEQLIVGAPDHFAAEWNETKHGPLLSRLAEGVVGRPAVIVFRVQEDRQRRPQMDFFVPQAPGAAPQPSVNGGSNQPLNERYTFETFVIGKSNELAAAAAHADRRGAGQDLQSAVHLRRHRPRQNPPDAGHCARAAPPGGRHASALRRCRAVPQRGDRKHPRPDHARFPTALPERGGPVPGRRRAFPGRQGADAGGVLSYLQRPPPGQQADRAHLRPRRPRRFPASRRGW